MFYYMLYLKKILVEFLVRLHKSKSQHYKFNGIIRLIFADIAWVLSHILTIEYYHPKIIKFYLFGFIKLYDRHLFRVYHNTRELIKLKWTISKEYKDAYLVCVFSNSLGEIVCFFANLNAYLQNHNITPNDRLVIVGWNERYIREILQLFTINAKVEVLIITRKLYHFIVDYNPALTHLKKGSIDPLPIYYDRTRNRIRKTDITSSLYEPISLIDYFKLYMGVYQNQPINHPVKTANQMQKAIQILENKNINYDNLIMICPESVSLKLLMDGGDYLKLAKKLKALGYEVIFNAKSSPSSEFRNIYESISDTAHIMHLCKFVIGARSGFLDIIASYADHPPIIAFYPHSDMNGWHPRHDYMTMARMFAGYNKDLLPIENYLATYSLHMYGIGNITEIVHKGEVNDLINKIEQTVIDKAAYNVSNEASLNQKI